MSLFDDASLDDASLDGASLDGTGFSEPVMTVHEFTAAVGGALQQAFPDEVWVEGEISNLKRSQPGHVYFDLVEPAETPGAPATARVSVALFRADKEVVNRLLKRAGGMRMTDGMAVRIRGAVDFYPPQGRLQLRMTSIDPTYTLGQLAAERAALLRRLAAEGLTEANRARPVPLFPARIGLITSDGSAAHADFVHELESAPYAWHVVLADSRVQGQGADLALAAAVRTLARHGVDVVAIVRGGGARGDLATFDSEVLARAIAAAPVPVYTGIGHEIDRSVADEVAHTAFKTPTAVAAALVDDARRFHARVDRLWDDTERAVRRHLDDADRHLDDTRHRCRRAGQSALGLAEVQVATSRHRVARAATTGLTVARRHLDVSAGALAAHAQRRVQRADELADDRARRLTRRAAAPLDVTDRHLAGLEHRLRLLDPARLLERGWSITTTAGGRAVRSVADAPPGTTIITTVADGTLTSSVSTTDPEPATEADPDRAPDE